MEYVYSSMVALGTQACGEGNTICAPGYSVRLNKMDPIRAAQVKSMTTMGASKFHVSPFTYVRRTPEDHA